MKQLVLLILIAAAAIPAAGQRVRFEPITLDEGISDIRVNAIEQDFEGYLWFGAQDGLNRYDGYDYVHYWHDPRDSTSISGNYIEWIEEAADSTLWVATWGYGLNRFNREEGTFTSFRAEEGGLVSNEVAMVKEDHQGRLWVATDEGLSRLDPRTGTWRTYRYGPDAADGLLNEQVRSILVDQEGTVWVANGSQFGMSAPPPGGLLRYQPETDSFIKYRGNERGLQGDLVVSLYEDSEGVLWVGTSEGGLHRFDRDRETFEPVFPEIAEQGYTTAVLEDHAGRFWVGTQNGLNLVDRRSGTVRSFSPDPLQPESISEARVWRLFEDRFGVIWIGCGGNACLDRIRIGDDRFRHASVAGLSILDLEAMGDSLVLATTRGLWSSSLDISTQTAGEYLWARRVLAGEVGLNLMYALDRTNSGNLIAAGIGMLLEYDPASGRVDVMSERDSLLGATYAIFGATRDRTGALWVVTTEGLLRAAPGEDAEQVPGIDCCVTGITTASDGSLLVSGDRLIRIQPESGEQTEYPNFLSVSNIGRTSRGTLWMASGGLVLPDEETMRARQVIGPSDGLMSNDIRGVEEDEHGVFWLATTRGVTSVDPATRQVTNYDNRDGLGGLTYEGVTMGSNGALYFGGANGVSLLASSEPPVLREPPITRITRFAAGGVDYQTSKEIRLPSSDNDVTLTYVGIQFDAPSRNRYRVRLDPLDADWVLAGTDREQRYTNLAPGDYSFQVEASNSGGNWSTPGGIVNFTIRPPWWRTPWAYILFGLGLAWASVAFHRSQRSRIAAREREATRERELAQAREIEEAYHQLRETQAQLVEQEKLASLGSLTAGIAHEIKNPLNFVNNFAEVNAELADELTEAIAEGDAAEATALLADLRDNATQIAKHGKRADSIVRAMMQHARGGGSEQETIDVNTFVEEYAGLAWHGMRARDDGFRADLVRELDPAAGSIQGMPQELGRVVLNLLNNAFDAVRGTPDAIVRLKTERTGEAVRITVSDNGPGIPENIRQQIFEPFFTTKPTGEGTGLGLSLSYDIVTKGHGGSMTVGSSAQGGAEFVIELPTPENGGLRGNAPSA